jgi:hypothetical protein
MKMSLRINLILSVLLTFLSAASISKVGTSAATFLKIEPDARSMGMGGAYVATANDASSLWWNPAGIARIGNSAAVLNHSVWFADISYNYAGVTLDLGKYRHSGFCHNLS